MHVIARQAMAFQSPPPLPCYLSAYSAWTLSTSVATPSINLNVNIEPSVGHSNSDQLWRQI